MIYSFPAGPFATNCYILACPTTKQAVIIDPGVRAKATVISTLAEHNLHPVAILLTHSHWDHIGDVAPLKEHFQIPAWVHAADRANLENPGADRIPTFGRVHPAIAEHTVKEGEVIPVGTLNIHVIETPGHTPGGVCYYLPEHAILISGDTLFKGSIGNLSLPTANADAMWPSLAKLAKLPANTKVYPGHGDSTTIGHETWLPNAQQHFGG